MAAARIMLDGGVGILRTMPDADRRDVDRLRLVARGLGIDWPDDESYGALLARLDGSTAQQAAFLDEASVLFRGAAYTLVDGRRADRSSTPRWRRRTRTSPRRCADWSTGMRPRPAWR